MPNNGTNCYHWQRSHSAIEPRIFFCESWHSLRSFREIPIKDRVHFVWTIISMSKEVIFIYQSIFYRNGWPLPSLADLCCHWPNQTADDDFGRVTRRICRNIQLEWFIVLFRNKPYFEQVSYAMLSCFCFRYRNQHFEIASTHYFDFKVILLFQLNYKYFLRNFKLARISFFFFF